MEIIVGTKAWSSWSMRPWLALKRTGAPFEETLIPLREAEASTAAIRRHSPSGLVPALRDGDLVIWDTLAICEYLAERFPEAGLWPAGRADRALARAASAEMHSGFSALRAECPMDLALRAKADLSAAARADIGRIVELWTGLLARSGGPFLFGDWCIADAFYTPVATRVRSYAIDLGADAAQAYSDRLLATPEYLAWEAGA
ncbi:MAG: glutathione S-transferase family protein [Pseudomonadota bacterium]